MGNSSRKRRRENEIKIGKHRDANLKRIKKRDRKRGRKATTQVVKYLG